MKLTILYLFFFFFFFWQVLPNQKCLTDQRKVSEERKEKKTNITKERMRKSVEQKHSKLGFIQTNH